tara:strand:+ start:7587 stop:7922 length:336 start_codon:yes stop_codon:yes gene_type:complete
MSDKKKLFTTLVQRAAATDARLTMRRLRDEGVEKGHHPIDVEIWRHAADYLTRVIDGKHYGNHEEFAALDELAQSHVARAVDSAIRAAIELMAPHPVLSERRDRGLVRIAE